MIWGIIISLLAIALMLFVLKGIKSNFELSSIGWIVVVVMFILLSFENTRLVSVIDEKLNTGDYIESVKETVGTCLTTVGYNHRLSQEEAQLVSIALKTAYPSMSRYIHASNLVGKDGTAIVDAIGVVAKKSLNRRLWHISGWILITCITGFVAVLLFSANKSKGRKTRYQSVASRRNTKYHSRKRR